MLEETLRKKLEEKERIQVELENEIVSPTKDGHQVELWQEHKNTGSDY